MKTKYDDNRLAEEFDLIVLTDDSHREQGLPRDMLGTLIRAYVGKETPFVIAIPDYSETSVLASAEASAETSTEASAEASAEASDAVEVVEVVEVVETVTLEPVLEVSSAASSVEQMMYSARTRTTKMIATIKVAF